jgi:hypothetical protein
MEVLLIGVGAKVKHQLAVTTPIFIQLLKPLLSLHTMVQSRHGATQIMEVQVHPLTKVIPRFIQII